MVSLCDDVDINDYKLTPKQQKVAEVLTVVDKASVKGSLLLYRLHSVSNRLFG